MKIQSTARGFTIVELVVVIAVIGILAAITTVAYTRSQDRSRAAQAEVNAIAVQQAAESYYSRYNIYPTAREHFTSSLVTLPSGVTLLTHANPSTVPPLNDQNGGESIRYRYVGTAPNATGACVFYWNFAPETGNARVSEGIYLGTATAANCSATAGNTLAP